MKTKQKRDLLLIASLCGALAACNLNTLKLGANDPNFNCQDSRNLSIAIAPETSPKITAALQTLVSSSSQTERNSSIDALAKMGPRVIIPLFSLRKNSCYWGNSILDAMYEVTRRIGSSAIPSLITILKTPDPNNQQQQVVFAAQQSLGKMGESVIPELMPLLTDTNVQLRHNATIVLGYVGKPAIPQLVSISKQDSDQAVRTLALKFLKELGYKPIQSQA